MKIYFAGDHAGFELKKELMDFVRSLGHEVEDLGPTAYNTEDDYPDFVIPLAKKVATYSPFSKGSTSKEGGISKSSVAEDGDTSFRKGGTEEVRGISVAGSGQGEAIAMNRIQGVRAAEFYGGNVEVVQKAREHNNVNVLSLGARFVKWEKAKAVVKLFLETPFSGDERHVRRLKKVDQQLTINN